MTSFSNNFCMSALVVVVVLMTAMVAPATVEPVKMRFTSEAGQSGKADHVTWDIFSQLLRRGVDALSLRRDAKAEAQSITPDGVDCLVCGISMVMVLDEAAREQKPIDEVLSHICSVLPSDLLVLCQGFVSSLTNETLGIIAGAKSADDACTSLGYCQECHLDAPYDGEEDPYYDYVYEERKRTSSILTGMAVLHHVLRGTSASDYYAELDSDGDLFSPSMDGQRDAYWRGRDCNDNDFNTRPGVYDDANGLTDNNCNGIYGVYDRLGLPWETVYCNSSSAMSVVMFGDSAAAGLYIPPEWLSFQNLSTLAEGFIDDLDWPHHTWSTGWDDSLALGGVTPNSIYQQMRARNLCNHRDYQSITRNGADMSWWVPQMEALTITHQSKPMLAFMAYIGDDVCRSELSHMTSPDTYEQYLRQGLQQFDQVVPAGSKLLAVGLINGSLSYDTMWNATHPLGVKYWQWYNFLTCTNSNPCQTWLNTNATMRVGATARAVELSSVLEKVVKETSAKWQNFEVDFVQYPLEQGVQMANQLGYPTTALIGPVDGFHPTPLAHNFQAQIIWNWLEANHPDWIGPVNPYNADIQQLFGDQGGY